jgi:hypothetical protein
LWKKAGVSAEKPVGSAAQDEIGKRVDPAADDLVMFQDFGDLGEPGGHKANQQAGQGDEDQGAVADKAMGFGGRVKDGPKYIHPTDDCYCEPGQPQPPLMVIRNQTPPGEQEDTETYQR